MWFSNRRAKWRREEKLRHQRGSDAGVSDQNISRAQNGFTTGTMYPTQTLDSYRYDVFVLTAVPKCALVYQFIAVSADRTLWRPVDLRADPAQ